MPNFLLSDFTLRSNFLMSSSAGNSSGLIPLSNKIFLTERLLVICSAEICLSVLNPFSLVLSEELNSGSFELLSTLPVSSSGIVVGKFLAALTFIALMLLPTLAYAFSVSMLGDLDLGPVFGGYCGALLLAGAYTGIGLLASSITRNQIIAFIIGMVLCFGLTIFNRMLFFVPESLLAVFAYMGSTAHFQNIARGIIDTRDLVYFLSLIFLTLYGTGFVLQEKK